MNKIKSSIFLRIFSGLVLGVVCFSGLALGEVEIITDHLTVEGDAIFFRKVEITQRQPPPEVPTAGLVLHYTFDTDESGIVTDQSGSGNNGVVNGAIFTPSGLFKGAMSFDGVDDSINSSTAGVVPDGTFTASIWLKWVDSGEVAPMLIVQGPDGFERFLCHVDSAQKTFSCTLNRNGMPFTIPSDLVVEGRWTYFAFAFDDPVARLYVNGVEVGSGDMSGLPGIQFEGEGTLNIGFSPQLVARDRDHFFKGLLDEVRVYNIALTSDQIIDLFLSPPPSLDVSADANFNKDARFNQGILFTAPLGDLDMGEFTAP